MLGIKNRIREGNVMKLKKKNVYEALEERIGRIFREYDYVYLSFLGGKDSGVLLNACVKYLRLHGGRMGVFHMDYEV